MAMTVIPCSLHNIAVVARLMDSSKSRQSVDTRTFPLGPRTVRRVAPQYDNIEPRKNNEDKVSARPTTPVT